MLLLWLSVDELLSFVTEGVLLVVELLFVVVVDFDGEVVDELVVVVVVFVVVVVDFDVDDEDVDVDGFDADKYLVATNPLFVP